MCKNPKGKSGSSLFGTTSVVSLTMGSLIYGSINRKGHYARLSTCDDEGCEAQRTHRNAWLVIGTIILHGPIGDGTPYPSFFEPGAVISRDLSAKGLCSSSASSVGAVIHVSISFGCTGNRDSLP
jgi:hypothetical protein